MPRTLAILAFIFGLAAPWIAHAGMLAANASCDADGRIVVRWTFYDDPFHPVDRPDWFGYDVLRRDMETCGAFERVNADPIPRLAGTHTLEYAETPPDTGVTYEYRVITIDVNRQWLLLGLSNCEPPCTGQAWPSCPDGSSPATIGTLHDHGWAIFVAPCPEGCWPYVYVEGNADVAALRPYADGVQVVALYGRIGCGSVEGCSLQLDRFELTACDPTPVGPATWGALKIRYR